jgi:hypothetical protein
MTAGNNGASTPEDDDPFGYLYEDGQAAAAQRGQGGGYGYPGPAAQPGVPRTSYNQVRTVGERQYGQPPQQQYGQQPQYGQQQYAGQQPQQPQQPQQGQQGQGGYGYPGPGSGAPGQYGQPPAPPAATTRSIQTQRGGGRGGPNNKGLLIGAVAVVLIVVVGITIALTTNSDKKTDDAGPSTAPTAGQSQQPGAGAGGDAKGDKPAKPLPKEDAATLQLGPPAAVASAVPGAKGADGTYVSLSGGPGASATWTVDVPKSGDYTLFTYYGVPGKDAKATLTVDDSPPNAVKMNNYAEAKEGDWEHGWTLTFNYIQLDKGSNTIKISCEQGDQCDANLDQVKLKAGHVDH